MARLVSATGLPAVELRATHLAGGRPFVGCDNAGIGRMVAAFQRSPKAEILRFRFREVQRLLRETDLPVESIALQTGFSYGHYLQTAFRERFGMTPGSFRRMQRGQD